MSEARITINGKELTEDQAMVVRGAVNYFFEDMALPEVQRALKAKGWARLIPELAEVRRMLLKQPPTLDGLFMAQEHFRSGT